MHIGRFVDMAQVRQPRCAAKAGGGHAQFGLDEGDLARQQRLVRKRPGEFKCALGLGLVKVRIAQGDTVKRDAKGRWIGCRKADGASHGQLASSGERQGGGQLGLAPCQIGAG